MGKKSRFAFHAGSALLRAVFIVSIILVLTTCDAFKAGLGPKIDIAAPTVNVKSIANGAYLRGTVTLTGTAADDVSVKSVAVIVNINSAQVASIPASISNGSWSAVLDTNALSGGIEVQSDLDIQVTDGSGKVSDQKLVVYFDNVAPVLTSMTPTADNLNSSNYAISEKEAITGSVKDGLGVAQLELDAGSLVFKETAHPAAWTITIDATQFYDSANLTTPPNYGAKNGATYNLASGLFVVPYKVQATDFAGNASAAITGNFYVSTDGSPIVDVTGQTPTINTTKLYPYPSTTPGWAPSSVLPGSIIKFRVFDQDGLDTSPSGLFVALAPGGVAQTTSNGPPEALINVVEYSSASSPASFKIVPIQTTQMANGTSIPVCVDCSVTLPDPMPHGLGEYLFYIRAKDYAANKLSGVSATHNVPTQDGTPVWKYVSLYISSGDPKVTVTLPADGSSMQAFSASGQITDDLGPLSVSLKIDNGAAVPAVLTYSTPTLSNWTYTPASPLSDGLHTIVFTGTNATGATSASAVTRNVTIDTVKPLVTVNANLVYQSGSTGIGGTSSDPGTNASGVAKVEYQLDGPVAGNWTTAVSTAIWNGNIDLSPAGITEGAHTLYVRATDNALNVSDPQSTTINVDKASPRATETNHTSTLIQSKNPVTFTGIADDAAITAGRTASAAVLSYSKDGGASVPLGIPDGFVWTQATGVWNYTLPVTLGDGLYTLTLTVTDVAGKTATVTRTVQIDTTAPTLVVSAPVNNESTSSTPFTISGTSRDTGGVGFSGNTTFNDVEYSSDGGSSWTALTLTGTSWSKSLNLGSTEGARTLNVRSTDKLGNQALSATLNFFYDLAPPTMTEIGVAGGGNPATFSISTNATIVFSGAVSDSDALAASGAFQVNIDAVGAADVSGLSAPYSYTQPGGAPNWQLSVQVGSGPMADGTHTFVFTAKDIAGKTTSVTRTVTVDTTKPASVIVTPPNLASSIPAYWLSGPTASIGGTASDSGLGASGVASVYYITAIKGAGQPAFSTSTWTLAAGASNWNGTVKLTGSGSIGEGEFTLYVAAVDAVGNIQTPVPRDFGVDQSNPTVDEGHAASSATKTAFTLSGNIGDTNALASLTVTEKKGVAAPESVTIATPATISGTGPTPWSTISLPIHGVADGSYLYTVIVTDIAGKTTQISRTVKIDTTPPNVFLTAIPIWVSASAYTIGGTADDLAAGFSGVATVAYNLDGAGYVNAAWVDTSGGLNKTGTWSATLTGLTEGTHSVQIQATDAAANTTTLTTTNFSVDLNPPTVTETYLNTTAQVTKNNSFTMTGTVGDSNPLSVAGTTLTVSVSVNGGAAVPATMAGSVWSYTQAKIDGSYSYVITATDVSGKTASLNRLVLLDSTPPTLGVSAPTPTPGTWVSSTTLSLSGSALDGAGSGVNKTYYLVDLAANDHSTDIAAWHLTSGASAPTSGTSATWAATTGLPGSWSGSSALSGEGAKILWIVSADNAGNTTALSKVAAGSFALGTVYTIAAIGTTDFTAVGAASNTIGLAFTATGFGSGSGSAFAGIGIAIPFGLDQNPPALTETAISTTTTVVRNSTVTFLGSASDSNALAAAHSLTVSVDGTAAADVAFTVAPAWSYTYSVNAVSHAQDGIHSFLFTATDVSGKTTAVSRSVQVDTTPASAIVTAPTAAIWTNATPYMVGGTASDASGAGVSQVWTLVDLSTNSHAADTTISITTGGVWKLATGTTNWTYSWPLAAEGTKTLWVAVLDVAGNWTTAYSSVNFGYDATSPTLTITPMGGFKATFPVAGTVSDAASGVATLQYKIDSGAFTPVTIAAGWSAAVPAAAFTALAEGSHTVTVQAIDSAGNQSTQASTFNKDSTPPTLTYNNISSGGGTVDQDSNPALTGTLADVSGVASAAYTLQAWNYSTQAWNAIATAASLGSPAAATSWSWSLDLSATGLNLPDGKYQIAIAAADVPGNAIASPLQVPFLLSRTNPGASFLSPSLGSFQNGAFPLVGTASDPNSVTLVRAKIASGAVDFSSGTTTAYPALPATIATGSPGVFTTPSPHGLIVGDQVYIWGSPMPLGASGSLVTGTAYLVQSATATTFTIATSGAPTVALAIPTSTATNILVGIVKDTFPTFHPSIPVTVAGSIMIASNHNLSNGDVVYFQGTTLPAPTTAATAYYVVNATAPNFQVSTTSGGGALTLTSSGTAVAVYSPTHAVNWMIPAMSVASFGDGPLTAYVQAVSGSLKTNQTSRDFTLDATAPTIAISSPASGTRSVGNLTIVGTSSDGGAIPSGVTGTIQYQLGINPNLSNGAANWTSANVAGGSYSWNINLGDMSGYANSTWAHECTSAGVWPVTPGSTNLWYLPIALQALDKAGNYGQVTSYFLVLDPNGNVPVLNVTQPANNLTFGGQQRISGTAIQPTWVHDVEVSVDPTNAGSFAATVPASTLAYATGIFTAASHGLVNGQAVYIKNGTTTGIAGLPVNPRTPYYVIGAAANTFQVSATFNGSAVAFGNILNGNTSEILNADSWFPATMVTTGNNVIWYYDINVGNIYPQVGSSQTVQVQVRGWNAPTAGGARGTIQGSLSAPLTMTFNSSFPKIQNLLIGGQNYYAQITARGNAIALTGLISSSKGISKIEVVESSPLSGSTTAYDTSTSNYGVTNASKGAYWSSTVSPTILSNVTFGASNTNKLMITATGSNPTLWTGAPGTTPGTVYTPTSNTTINVTSTGGAFIESDASGNFNYPIAMTIDSTQLYNATTGQYSFDIRATDVTSPSPQISGSTVTLNEDNYYPTSIMSKPGVVSAGSFAIGARYTILSVGSTDFTAVGALSNTVGLNFMASGTGSGTGTALSVLTGTSFKIQGSATDSGAGSGTIGGLNKVIVYLTNAAGTQVLDIKAGGASAATQTLTGWDMATGGSGSASATIPYPNTAAYSNYFASIDTLAEIGAGDTNGDGFLESFTINGNARDWWAQFDTTKLSDGPVTVHYVIWDQAGNATHYAQSAFVSNNAPTLQSITLGTDLTGLGTFNSTQTFTSNYGSTGFTVRNGKLSFQVSSNYGNGSTTPNGVLAYQVKYSGTNYWGGAGTSVTGASSNASTLNFNTWSSLSPPIADAVGATFTLTVTDTLGQSYSQAVTVNIQNTDSVPPVATLTAFSKATDLGYLGYALNGATTIAGASNEGTSGAPIAVNPRVNRDSSVTSGGNAYYILNNVTAGRAYSVYLFNQTIPAGQTSLSVYTSSGFGSAAGTASNGAAVDNIVTGVIAAGTYGTASNLWIKVSGTTATNYRLAAVEADDDGGHMELVPNPNQVSGTIVLRGHAHDNQRVQNLRLNVASYNLGSGLGSDQLLATWNGGTLSMQPVSTAYGHLVIQNETLNQTAGHDFDWIYYWNTSLVTGVGRNNVVLTVKTEDFNAANNGQAGTSATRTVSIVPYITNITTLLSNAYKANPSTISRTAVGHYPVNTGETVIVNGYNLNGTSTTVALNGTGLTVSSATPADDLYRIGSAIGTTATSGALSATVSGVVSINNTPHNAEPNNQNNNNLTDDRYLDVWAVSTFIADSTAKYPHMRIDTTANQNVFFAFGESESDYWLAKNTTAITSPAIPVAAASTATTILEQAPSKYAYNALALDQDAAPNYYAVALDTDRTANNYGTTGATKLNFFARQQGSAWQYPGATNGNYSPGTYKRQLEGNWNGYAYQSLRSMYPDMAVTGTGAAAKVYMTYYDQVLGITKFRYGSVGAGVDNGLVDGTGLIGGALNGNIVPATAATTLQYKVNATAAGVQNEGTTATPIDLGRAIDRSAGATAAGSFYRLPVLANDEIEISLFNANVNTATMKLYSDAAFTAQVGATTNATTAAYGFLDYVVPAIGVNPSGTPQYLYLKVTGSVALTYHVAWEERGSIQGYHILGGPGQTAGGGAYSAVGVISNGDVVAAWYDQINQALKFSWIDSVNVSASASVAEPIWQAHTVTLDPNFAGWWASIAVDGNDKVHLAYYDAGNAALKYAYIADYKNAATNTSLAAIDSYLSTGTDIHINVKQDPTSLRYVPYISYYTPAFTQTKYSLKLAYRVDQIGASPAPLTPVAQGYSNGYATGSWEISTLPLNNVPQDYQTSMGFRNMGLKTKQPIIGFGTTADVEVAQLK